MGEPGGSAGAGPGPGAARLEALHPLKPEFQQLARIALSQPEFTLGRSLDCSAVITFLAISRRHCTFRHTEDVWTIEDSSAFGVHLNERKLKKGIKHQLNHNDVLRLDPNGEFVYKFIMDDSDYAPPIKRTKIENENVNVIKNVRQKFEESQSFEVDHMQKKIKNVKQLQTTSIILKQQLELDMERKIQSLNDGFNVQIESLRGERDEVERQKAELEKERDEKLSDMKREMDDKISELLDQIAKHNKTESQLLDENSQLKERLVKEREVFLQELHRENASKQGLLEQLEEKLRHQEETRLQEKQLLEESLKMEVDRLNAAKEKALKELEEQMRQEKALKEAELQAIRLDLERQMNATVEEKTRAEREYQERLEQLQRTSREDKCRIEEMCQAREEAEKRLREAQQSTEKSRENLERIVAEKELEYNIMAVKKVQEENLKSHELVNNLQAQLNKVRQELEVVEVEKLLLQEQNPAPPDQSVRSEFGELMESELQCTICSDLLIQAVTLNCSHTFCKYCIARWKKKKKECPVCRTPITSECRSLVLDSFIEKMVASLTEDIKVKRMQVLKDREELEAQSLRGSVAGARLRRRTSSYGGSTPEYPDTTEDDTEGEGEGEGEADYDYGNPYGFNSGSDQESTDDGEDAWPGSHIYARYPTPAGNSDGAGTAGSNNNTTSRSRQVIEGVPGSYYGGYGRCFNCGARGHWAPGCPFS